MSYFLITSLILQLAVFKFQLGWNLAIALLDYSSARQPWRTSALKSLSSLKTAQSWIFESILDPSIDPNTQVIA